MKMPELKTEAEYVEFYNKIAAEGEYTANVLHDFEEQYHQLLETHKTLKEKLSELERIKGRLSECAVHTCDKCGTIHSHWRGLNISEAYLRQIGREAKSPYNNNLCPPCQKAKDERIAAFNERATRNQHKRWSEGGEVHEWEREDFQKWAENQLENDLRGS